MGGGAVAVADPDSTGSAAHGDDGINASVQGSATASSQVDNVTDTLRKTIQRVTSTLARAGNQASSLPSARRARRRARRHGHRGREEGSALVAADANVVPPLAEVVAPVAEVVAPVAEVVAPVAEVAAPVAEVGRRPERWRRCRGGGAGCRGGGAGCRGGGAGSRGGGAGSRGGDAGSRGGAPIPAVAPVPEVVTPVPDVVTPVPDLVAPASAVIAFLQDMLTAGASAVVPLTQLQSDLYSWFSSLSASPGCSQSWSDWEAPPVLGCRQPRTARWRRNCRCPGTRRYPGRAVGRQRTGVATLEGIAASIFGATSEVGRGSSLPGMPPLAPAGAIPMGVRLFFLHACELRLSPHCGRWPLSLCQASAGL